MERTPDRNKNLKKTKLGNIPIDWNIADLGISSTLKARIGWQGLTTAEYLKYGEYYLITGTDFKNGKINWKECHYVSKNRFDQDVNIQLRLNDILVTKDGTIGKVAIVDKFDKDGTLNSGVFVIRPLRNAYEPKYMYYVLMSKLFRNFLDRLAAGSTISHLYQKDFVHFSFLVPTLREQKQISLVLSDADKLIESLEMLILKKKDIKLGTMQQLLSGKIRVDGYNEPFNEIELGNMVTITRGSIITEENAITGKIPVIAGGKKPSYYHNKSNRIGKTITISGSGANAGYVNYFTIPIYASDCSTISENKHACIKFVYYQMILLQSEIYNLQTGGAQPHIHPKDLKPLKIGITDLEEQKAIANILSDMDLEIVLLEKELEKYKQIKQGMMQDLLTGRIRLL